jgi:DNA-binding transcriptional MerR regulator
MDRNYSSGFKMPPKLYRIGDLVRCTSFTRQTLHNYTIMGLIQEASWTEGGHRLYDETVFERLWQIQQLRETKSLSEIRDLFRSAQVVKAS